MVIVDEAHLMHKETFRWMADGPDVPFIGLSATPWSRDLGKYYDALIKAAIIREVIEKGYLSRYTVFAPRQSPILRASARSRAAFMRGS